MNTNIVILFILIVIIYFITTRETLDNTTDKIDSYYIDALGDKHVIKDSDLPLTLNDITSLRYTSTSSNKIKFVTTKGSYTTVQTKNQINIINNKPTMYQLLHISNVIPFSGILF
jgi:hypothetical protein